MKKRKSFSRMGKSYTYHKYSLFSIYGLKLVKLSHFLVKERVNKLRVNERGFEVPVAKQLARCRERNPKCYAGRRESVPCQVAVDILVMPQFFRRTAQASVEI